MPKINAVDCMDRASKTYNDRAVTYGCDGFEAVGRVMAALFPEGVDISGEISLNRFSLINMMVTKLCRYTQGMANGGHRDSIHDLGVYAFMLESYDTNYLSIINPVAMDWTDLPFPNIPKEDSGV